MQDVQTQAIETYQKNILFFQEHYKEIYDKITIISDAIEDGRYQQRYSLEYKNSAFDILDLQTNQYLYGSTSSTQHAKEAAKSINLKKDESVIETFYNWGFSKESIEYATQEDPTVSQFVLTAPIIQFSRDLLDKKTTTMKQIYKFIFFGVGLGLHITEIDKKTQAYMYMIVEDNLEIFRLSLFVTDYADIGKDSELYFSIMQNNDEFKLIFESFYHRSFIRNNYIKYSLFYPDYKEKIANIQSFIVTQGSMNYLHDKLLMKNINVLKSIKENYNFIDISKHYSDTPFSKKSVILIAAGPSLKKEKEWLKKNAPYTIIIALFMTLPILEEYNIVPDIIFHIDENMEIVDKTILRLKNKEALKDSFFFLSPSIHCSRFLEIAKKEHIYLFEDRTRYRSKKGHIESFSVGEVAYALSLIFDTHELYLLGLDLALDNETKQTHAQGHNSSSTKRDLSHIKESDSVSLRGTELTIKGNLREEVSTTPLFDMSRILLNEFTKKFKQNHQHVYNLNDGAYFTDTLPTYTKDIDFTNTTIKDIYINQELKSFFDKNSDNFLDEEELNALKERVKDNNKIKEKIVLFANKKTPTLQQFQQNFTDTASSLILPSSNMVHELPQIYLVYLENIGGYIGDFFNTSNIPNPKRNIKQFQKIITQQLLKIADKYMEGLNEAKDMLR